MVTSVLFDLPVRTTVETEATSSYTFYTNGTSITTFYDGAVDNSHSGLYGGTNLASGNTYTPIRRIMYISDAQEKCGSFDVLTYTDDNSNVDWTYQTTTYNGVKTNVTRTVDMVSNSKYTFSTILLQFVPNSPTTTVNYAHTEGGNPIKIANNSIEVDNFSNYTSAELSEDTFIDVTAGTAKDGYLYIGWLSATGTKKTRNYNITTAQGYNSGNGGTFTATYAKKYPITYQVASGSDGTISPNGDDYYAYWKANQQYVKDALDYSTDGKSIQGATVTGIDTSAYKIEWHRTDTDEVVSEDWNFIPSDTLIEEMLSNDVEPVFEAKLIKRITVNYIQGGVGKNRLNGAGANATITAVNNPSYYYIGLEDSEQIDFSPSTASDTNANDWIYWQDDNGIKIISGYNTAEVTLETIKNYISAYPEVSVINLTATSKRTNFSVQNENSLGDEAGSFTFAGNNRIMQLIDGGIKLNNKVTVADKPENGYTFDHWEISTDNRGNVAVGNAKTLETLSGVTRDDFLNNSSYTVIACYKTTTQTLTFTSVNYGYGNIQLGEADPETTVTVEVEYDKNASGIITAKPVEGARFKQWNWTNTNGDSGVIADQTINLAEVFKNVKYDYNIKADYEVESGYTEIRYEVVNIDNNICYPVELTCDGVTVKDTRSKNNSNNGTSLIQPVISEIVKFGDDAKGCVAYVSPDKFEDDNTYTYVAWKAPNNRYIFSDNITEVKPTAQEIKTRTNDYTTSVITFQAEGRQTKNYYILAMIDPDILDDTGIYYEGIAKNQLTNGVLFLGADKNGSTVPTQGDLDSNGFRVFGGKIYTKNDTTVFNQQSKSIGNVRLELPDGYELDYWSFNGENLTDKLIEYHGNHTTATADEALAAVIDDILSVGGTNSDLYLQEHKYNYLVAHIKCKINIEKTYDEAPTGFGNPAFTYRITGIRASDGQKVDYTVMINDFNDNKGTASINVPQGTYTITEISTIRYSQVNGYGRENDDDKTGKTIVTPGNSDGNNADSIFVKFDSGAGIADVKFENKLSNYGKRSYSDSKVNHINIPKS